MVDELIIWGSAGQCREHLGAYVDAGVTTPVVALLPFGYDERLRVPWLCPAEPERPSLQRIQSHRKRSPPQTQSAANQLP